MLQSHENVTAGDDQNEKEAITETYSGTVMSKVKVGKGLLLVGLRVSPNVTVECGISSPTFTLEAVKQFKNDIRIGDKYACTGKRNGRIPKKRAELAFSVDCCRVVCLEHCVLGNTGGYRQVTHSSGVAAASIAQPVDDLNILTTALETNVVSEQKLNHGDKKARRQRAEVFVQFVLASFSDSCLSSGVLDVAGGRGGVSMALAEAGVPALVIDPREHSGCLNPRLRREMKKRGLSPLKSWHIFFPPDAQSLVSEEAEEFTPLLDKCQVLLGLHPDEATESIVDWAIENQRGFCVVPCCVFARLFPGRRLAGACGAPSRPVRTHLDLCAYLMQKHKGIRRSELNFEGMNTCLWATAEDLTT